MEARNEVVERNLGFIKELAQRYSRNEAEFDDLVQEGILGLIDGIERFDPSKGVKLLTYATWRIRPRMFREIRERDRIIHIPEHRLEEMQLVVRAHHQGVPTEEIARTLERSPEEVEDLWLDALNLSPLSLSDPINGDNTNTLEKIVPCAAPSQEEALISREYETVLNNALSRALQKLPERLRTIVCLRWEIEGNGWETYERIGEILGISRERARVLTKQAVERLGQDPDLKAASTRPA